MAVGALSRLPGIGGERPAAAGPAVAETSTAKPATRVCAVTVTTSPSNSQAPSSAPFALATEAATTQGSPGTMPTRTSAAASAAASAAPPAACFAESTI